jgi:hypothetical protein
MRSILKYVRECKHRDLHLRYKDFFSAEDKPGSTKGTTPPKEQQPGQAHHQTKEPWTRKQNRQPV